MTVKAGSFALGGSRSVHILSAVAGNSEAKCGQFSRNTSNPAVSRDDEGESELSVTVARPGGSVGESVEGSFIVAV